MGRNRGLTKTFGQEKPIIGALHFSPLLGYKGFRDLNEVLKNALLDLKALEMGGVNGVVLENNYDFPHRIFVNPETVAAMTYLGAEIRKRTNLPLGVSVLWNDYKASLSIAKVIGGAFVRISSFVDDISTDFGEIHPDPDEIVAYRKSIGAEKIALFSDIQVKYSKNLNGQPIERSAMEAEKKCADAVIVSGKATGEPPAIEKLVSCKNSVGIPVLIGSGMDAKNAASLLRYADGAIVGTYFKAGKISGKERNAKPYTARVDVSKVKKLMRTLSV